MICCESPTCPAASSDIYPAGPSPAKNLRRARGGFTLLEVLIATAVTLLMMISLAQIFKVIGDSMQEGRSVLELNNRLRSVAFRLRSDLDNLTVVPAPPADPSTGSGYLEVFDGSTTDFTAATKLLPLGAASRFGDVDDILMATVRAGDVWFTGKVPRYLTFLPQQAPDPTKPEHFELVSIASQHAEIAVFVQPLVTNEGNPNNRDPGFFLTSPLKEAAFENTDQFPDFPDSFRLYYRTLLIRPDLNLPSGVLASGVDNSTGVQWLEAVALPNAPTPMCDMANVHQQCDLSVRRVYNTGDVDSDYVAANSLEDLADPANRFAHVQIPIPGTVSTTMPVMALGARLPVNGLDPSGTLQVGSGFLHPAFVLLNNRAGEDLLASNVLAFDIKLFDPDVPLLGVDDLILSPSDPGYAAALSTGIKVGTGEYVDLAWAKKLVDHSGVSPSKNLLSLLSGFSDTNTFSDSLIKSGSVLMAGSNLLLLQPSYDTYTTRYEGDGVLQAQLNGGRGVCRINGVKSLYDNSLPGDDSTNLSESWRTTIDMGTDGIDNNISIIFNGVNLTGVDDPSEMETSAPFPTPLRGLKISVRMEDPTTRQVKQMSATKEFVSQ